MDPNRFERIDECTWLLPKAGPMRVPGRILATEALLRAMDDKVGEQLANVASLPGIVGAACAMPDAHWGYGFPIGGVAAFDPDEGGVISAGGVGFDISCGVRCLTTRLVRRDVLAVQARLADALFAAIPAGVGSTGTIVLDDRELDRMLRGGARWAVERGYGTAADLARIEASGSVADARPEHVGERARDRQRREMGTLGSGNHYLEVQVVTAIDAADVAHAYGLAVDDVVVSIHCGSRGLGHQIGTDYLHAMAVAAPRFGLALPDRELASAPIRSALGQEYAGAMRAASNCALANRQILTHLCRATFAQLLPAAQLDVLYDVSHNTCKVEWHTVDGRPRELWVHRKGATRAFGPGHPELPPELRAVGQPVLVGGSMGTASYVLAGTARGMRVAFGSACHGAGRAMSRNAALRQHDGRAIQDELRRRGILVVSPSTRGIAEEAPDAYKDVAEVVHAAAAAGIARVVARLEPLVCIKG